MRRKEKASSQKEGSRGTAESLIGFEGGFDNINDGGFVSYHSKQIFGCFSKQCTSEMSRTLQTSTGFLVVVHTFWSVT